MQSPIKQELGLSFFLTTKLGLIKLGIHSFHYTASNKEVFPKRKGSSKREDERGGR